MKILNPQLRPPETGFALCPSDLKALKEEGVKIALTCHEYKLNFSRRWLQTILHAYFSEAELVFFFNQKDLNNAAKHADR